MYIHHKDKEAGGYGKHTAFVTPKYIFLQKKKR
jgi:hypothetical protein